MIVGKKTQSKGRNRLITDISDFEPTKVKMEAGDLIIFNSCLPHCIRSNQSEKVQIAQYIAILPAEEGSEKLKLKNRFMEKPHCPRRINFSMLS